MIEIVDSTLSHARELSRSLREGDKKEIILMGLEPHKGVFKSFKGSVLRRTALVDGSVAAMWGVGGSPLGLIGRPYLLTGTLVETVSPFRFASIYKEEVQHMRIFPLLENYVDSSYTQAVRMLSLAGFELSEDIPYNGGLIRRFSMEGK